MALSTAQIKSKYPLPVYNYRVTILLGVATALGLKPVDPSLSTVISCSAVSGLSMELEPVVYKHGFSFLTGSSIIPGQRQEVRLSIQKGVTRDSTYFSDWIKLCYPIIQPLPMSLTRKRDIIIDLCDEEGKPVVRWKVSKAMPIKLEAPGFDANSEEVAFEQLDLIAEQLTVDYNP